MAGQLDETIQLLEQVHALDAQNVGRADALGRAFELTPAVPMISRTIDFFRQIPISTLHELGEGQRSLIYNLAQDFLSFYGRMMTIDPAASNRRVNINKAVPALDREGYYWEATYLRKGGPWLFGYVHADDTEGEPQFGFVADDTDIAGAISGALPADDG